MGKRTSLMMTDDLFERAEKARAEARALAQQLAALQELRLLERDFRAITRELANTIQTVQLPTTSEGLHHMIREAEEWIVFPPPPRLFLAEN